MADSTETTAPAHGVLVTPTGETLAQRILAIRQGNGMSVAEFIRRGRRESGTHKVGTLYRANAGTTPDPRVSSFVDLCNALRTDPDTLLGFTLPPLDAELLWTLREVGELDEEDRWLADDMLRAVFPRLQGLLKGPRRSKERDDEE